MEAILITYNKAENLCKYFGEKRMGNENDIKERKMKKRFLRQWIR